MATQTSYPVNVMGFPGRDRPLCIEFVFKITKKVMIVRVKNVPLLVIFQAYLLCCADDKMVYK